MSVTAETSPALAAVNVGGKYIWELGQVRVWTLYQTRALSQPHLGNHQRATPCLIHGNYTLPVNYKFITADGFEHFKYPKSKYRNPVNPKIVTTVLFKLVLETSH